MICIIVSLLPTWIITQKSDMKVIIRKLYPLHAHSCNQTLYKCSLIIIHINHMIPLLVPVWNDHKLYKKNTIFINDKFRGSIIRLRFYCFRNCNSNISSCTTSNSIEYHVCGSHVVHMSIFQLSGFPYEYDIFYLTVIFDLSIHYESFVLPCININNFIDT